MSKNITEALLIRIILKLEHLQKSLLKKILNAMGLISDA